MAAELSASMEAVGLKPLSSACLSQAFEGAGVLPHAVHARISRGRFAKASESAGCHLSSFRSLT